MTLWTSEATRSSTSPCRRGVDHSRDRCAPQEQRRQIQRRQKRPAGVTPDPGVGPVREHQGEMQEQGRQQELRRQVTPVEHPVERIQTSGEREREHAEERHRQPEEMERRLVVRTSQPD